MSLMDTIKGAREEALEAGTILTANRGDAQKAEAASAQASSTAEGESSTGFSRRSAARAKPTRSAAGSVRTGSKPTSEMTKEEKKVARREQRDDQDLMSDAKRAYLELDENYRRTQRIWWILIVIGMACSIVSFFIMRSMQAENNGTMTMAGASAGLMVVAYTAIIGAFIFDMVKVRPMRKVADNKVLGMSKRKMRLIIEENEERKRAKKRK